MSKQLRLLSVFLTIAFVFGSLYIPAGAISFQVGDTIGTGTIETPPVNKNLTSDGAVTYAKALYKDSEARTQAVHVIEFNPQTSDYMPYVYSKWTGTGCDVLRSAQQAESQFGAVVIAGLNATFYDTKSGSTYAGYWVHDGRLAQASAGLHGKILTFTTDGKAKEVDSRLDFKIYLDGTELTYSSGSALGFINKSTPYREIVNGEKKWYAEDVDNRIYYWDTECGKKTDSKVNGLEILCEKLDYGQLSIGNTLKGRVLKIMDNTKGSDVGPNEFVLYVKNESPLKAKLQSMAKVGSIIEISVLETIEASKTYTENANAAIAAQYKIVEKGVYSPDKDTLALDHYNLRAQRCLLGIKEDGTVIFMSTAGRNQPENDNAEGLTIPELGQIAIQLGCYTAYNLDGGGSTQMIISEDSGEFEYAHKSLELEYGRLVANCIYVVKKQSSSNCDGVKSALTALIEENKNNTSQAVQDAIAKANDVLANSTSMDGDYTRVYMKLKQALSGKVELDNAIASASGISYKDYSPTVLQMIWDAYRTAVAVRGNENATAEEIDQITKQLNSLLQLKGEVSIKISTNKPYTKLGGIYTNPDPKYVDTNDAELTDGIIAPPGNLYGYEWVCFHSSNRGGTEDGAPYYDVTIDLGKVESNLKEFKVYTEHVWDAGIEAPTKVVIFVSEDGTNFTQAGLATSEKSANLVRSANDKSDSTKVATTHLEFTLQLNEGVSGRYVKFHLVGGKMQPMLFVTELEVYKTDKPVDKAIFVTGMNAKINTNDSIIFTPDYATDLNGNNANLNWAFAIAAQWDDAKKAYVVVQTASGNGSNAIKTVPQNGFVLGVHGDSGDGAANKAYASKIKVGDIIVLNGIDLATKSMLPGAYIQYYTPQTDATVKPGSKVRLENGYATGIRNETTVTALLNQFNGTIVVRDANGNVITGNQLVGTGATINTGSTVYTVVVKGDLDGDGYVDSVDALLLKRGIIGTTTLSALQLKAGIFDDSTEPSATDYLILKRYILGTQDIYAN